MGKVGGGSGIPLFDKQTRKIKHVDFGKFGEVRVGGVKHEWVEGD